MKITCPNCTTSYQVPDDYISGGGRKVRCARCGDTFLAKAEEPKAAPMPLEEGLESSQSDADAIFDSAAEGGEEQSQDDIDALFDSPSSGDEEQDQAGIDALFDGPSGGDEEQDQAGIDALFDSPSGGGEEQDQDGIDALFDSPSGGGEEQDQDGIDALFDSPSGGEEQSQDDIDNLFGGDDAGAEPAGAVVAATAVAEADGAVVDMVDAEAFEEQKAIARGQDIESSAKRRKRPKRRADKSRAASGGNSSRQEWMMGGGAMAASLMLVVFLFAAPASVVRMLPDLASFYSMIGMPVNLGGVAMDNVKVQLVQKSGAPVIAVEAELVNQGAEPVLLPSVQLSVLGIDGAELYSWVVGPDGVGLGPGERKLVATSVAAPSQARKLSLRVAEPM